MGFVTNGLTGTFKNSVSRGDRYRLRALPVEISRRPVHRDDECGVYGSSKRSSLVARLAVDAPCGRDGRQECRSILPRVVDAPVLRSPSVDQPLSVMALEVLVAIYAGCAGGQPFEIVAMKFDELEMPTIFEGDPEQAA